MQIDVRDGKGGRRFLRRWIAANALAELVGLGIVAGAGWYLVGAHPARTLRAVLAQAGAMVLLGGVEGWIVGMAQRRVLRACLPALAGWTRATVAGALCCWVLGMAPSTIMHLAGGVQDGGTAGPGLGLRLALAVVLGLVAGPLLAVFQWRCLRTALGRASRAWLPANGLAWAIGMPVVFATVHVVATRTSAIETGIAAAAGLAAAGAVVGTVHGRAMLRLLRAQPQPGNPASVSPSAARNGPGASMNG